MILSAEVQSEGGALPLKAIFKITSNPVFVVIGKILLPCPRMHRRGKVIGRGVSVKKTSLAS